MVYINSSRVAMSNEMKRLEREIEKHSFEIIIPIFDEDNVDERNKNYEHYENYEQNNRLEYSNLNQKLHQYRVQFAEISTLFDQIEFLSYRLPVPLLRLLLPQYSLSARAENVLVGNGDCDKNEQNCGKNCVNFDQNIHNNNTISKQAQLQIIQNQHMFSQVVINHDEVDMGINGEENDGGSKNLNNLKNNENNENRRNHFSDSTNVQLLSSLLTVSPTQLIKHCYPPIYSLYYLHQNNTTQISEENDENDKNNSISIQPEHTQEMLTKTQFLSLYITLGLLYSLPQLQQQYKLYIPTDYHTIANLPPKNSNLTKSIKKTIQFSTIHHDLRLFFTHNTSIFEHFLPLFYSELISSHTLSSFIDFSQCTYALLTGHGVPQSVITYVKAVANFKQINGQQNFGQNISSAELVKGARYKLEQASKSLQNRPFSFIQHNSNIESSTMVLSSSNLTIPSNKSGKNGHKNGHKNDGKSTNNLFEKKKKLFSKEPISHQINAFDTLNEAFFAYGTELMSNMTQYQSVLYQSLLKQPNEMTKSGENVPQQNSTTKFSDVINIQNIGNKFEQFSYQNFGLISAVFSEFCNNCDQNNLELLLEHYVNHWDLILSYIDDDDDDDDQNNDQKNTNPYYHSQSSLSSTSDHSDTSNYFDYDSSYSQSPYSSSRGRFPSQSSNSPTFSVNNWLNALTSLPGLVGLCSELNNKFVYCGQYDVEECDKKNEKKSQILFTHFNSLELISHVMSFSNMTEITPVSGYISSNYPIYNKYFLSHKNSQNPQNSQNSQKYFFSTQYSRHYFPQLSHYLLTLLGFYEPTQFNRTLLIQLSSMSTIINIFAKDLALYPQFNPTKLIASRIQLPELINFNFSNLFQISISPIITLFSLSLFSKKIKNTISPNNHNDDNDGNDDIFGAESEFNNDKYYTIKFKRHLNAPFFIEPTNFSPQTHVELTTAPSYTSLSTNLIPFPLLDQNLVKNSNLDKNSTLLNHFSHFSHPSEHISHETLHNDYLLALALPKSTLNRYHSSVLSLYNLESLPILQTEQFEKISFSFNNNSNNNFNTNNLSNFEFLKLPKIMQLLQQHGQWINLHQPKEINLTYYLVDPDADDDGDMSMAALMASVNDSQNQKKNSNKNDENDEKNSLLQDEINLQQRLSRATTSTSIIIQYPQTFPMNPVTYHTDDKLSKLDRNTSLNIKHMLQKQQQPPQITTISHPNIDDSMSIMPTMLSTTADSISSNNTTSTASISSNSTNSSQKSSISTSNTLSVQSISDTALLWYRLVDDVFHRNDSVCSICFSGVDTKTAALPTVRCDVCDNSYHPSCLFTWFKESSKSTCPLCRANF
jgi:hypothetical protein